MKKNNTLLIIIIAVITLIIGFFGGMQYQKGQVSSWNRARDGQITNQNPQGQTNGQRGINPQNGNTRGGMINGEITAKDENSITVKTVDGGSKIVIFSESTSINKSSEATVSDLAVGETVSAFGTTNSDGSILAETIQLNPVFKNNPVQK